ncbi:MAG: MBL fold metallo-hydrolase [Armatimonadetes bacterium]|nr:MBL fold metallo-hydrolase [Armatimonadota bacterium]
MTAATPPLSETRVRPHVIVWTLGGESMQTSYGANCVAVIGQDAVLLVDPLIAPAHARPVAAALRRHTEAPVRLVALTHHHTDHTLGAAFFAAQGAQVVAHRACRERMAEEHPGLIAARREAPATRDLFADASSVLPTVTFDEALVLHVGEVEVEVWHPGWGHTRGDAFFFLPADRVAICGDLVWSGYHCNYEDADLSGVREGLRALRALDADTFIPGHGPAGGPEILDEQAGYHEVMAGLVRDAAAKGLDDAAIAGEVRARFPNHLLGLVIPTAVVRLKL